MIKAVVGANWGDEGKGKITDMLAQEASSGCKILVVIYCHRSICCTIGPSAIRL